MRESGWLIERFKNSQLFYWAGYEDQQGTMACWEITAARAVRFAREIDAAHVLSRICNGNGRVAEHVFDTREPAGT